MMVAICLEFTVWRKNYAERQGVVSIARRVGLTCKL